MSCIITISNNIEWYSDANWIIGRMKQNSLVDMYLLLVEEQSLRNISKETCIANSTMIFELGALDKVGE